MIALEAWTAARTWNHEWVPAPLRYELDHDAGQMLCVTVPSYAECMGPSDPFCGLCRFSTHGCGDQPTRAAFTQWVNARADAWWKRSKK